MSLASDDTIFHRAWVQERLDHVVGIIQESVEGVEAVFAGQEASYLRLAESRVSEASDVVEGKITVRVVDQGRSARVTTTNLTTKGLSRTAKEAVQRARSTAPTPDAGRLPPKRPIVDMDDSLCVDADTLKLTAAQKRAWLVPALRAHEADDLSLAGRFHSGLGTYAVRSSRGVEAFHQGTWVDLCMSALQRPAGHKASSFRAYFDTKVDQPVLDALQTEVRDECHRAHDPVKVDLGAWDVVLAPSAVAELLEWLGHIGFSSRSVDDEISFLTNRFGQQITGASVSIVDDASMPHGVGVPLPFDVEGQPKERVSLIEHGIAKGIVHDTASGRRSGCQSTGHAQHQDTFPETGSFAGHLCIEPGTARVEDMIGSVERGLLVTRFHYVNGLLDPRRAMMTGLLRDGAFLIQDGKPGKAVESMRFTDSILEAFERIPGKDAISKNVEAHSRWFSSASCSVAPYVLIPGLRFTSGR